MPKSKPIFRSVVCAAGLLLGGLAGLAVGWQFGSEQIGMLCYVFGAIGGVIISCWLFLGRD